APTPAIRTSRPGTMTARRRLRRRSARTRRSGISDAAASPGNRAASRSGSVDRKPCQVRISAGNRSAVAEAQPPSRGGHESYTTAAPRTPVRGPGERRLPRLRLAGAATGELQLERDDVGGAQGRRARAQLTRAAQLRERGLGVAARRLDAEAEQSV